MSFDGTSTSVTNFDKTTRDAIQKKVIATLRAGLIALPRGAVVPANVMGKVGDNFTLRATAYPDLDDSAVTSPLTEGIPPSPVKLGIDTLDFTVGQIGAYTAITDLAEFQSPHNLSAVSQDKIARLAAQAIDNLGLTALLAHATDNVTGTVLKTKDLLDAKAALASRNVAPIPGVGYYALTHPNALRGLEGEADLNGYVDVTSDGPNARDLTAGAVSQYRGITFLTSTRIAVDASGLYPVIFLGKDSIAFGDVSTMEYFSTAGADSGNPLAQFKTAGFKGILGGSVLHFAETTDGAGSNDADVDRVYTIAVETGVGS